MPQLGETVTEGTILRWLKAVGEPVAHDEVLFEVSTDKVDSEVPSPVEGILSEILVPEGETVEVGARLAVITESGVPEAAPSTGARAGGSPTSPEPAQTGAGTAPPRPRGAGQVSEERLESEERRASEERLESEERRASEETGEGAAGAGGAGGNGRVLSPMVRRLLSEHSLDPSQITGTGPGGRITRDDVLKVVDARRSRGLAPGPAPPSAQAGPSSRAPSPAPAAAPTPVPGAREPDGLATASPRAPATGAARDEVVPFTNIRRRTAEHMVRSRATSAHTYMAVEADFENVEILRRAERERFKSEEGVSLTYLPFIARAVVEGLRAYPHLNASVGEDELIVHHDIHLGIAVDLDAEGLIVPVIHDAEGKRLPALAREIAELASRARSRKLTADDIAGGTFTITNAGPMGTLITLPIINQPQVAILSTDGVHRKPVVVTDSSGAEAVAIHSVGVLAVGFDHRAVDGAYAAGFLSRLRETIERRDWSQEL